jgi:hypothetical protein
MGAAEIAAYKRSYAGFFLQGGCNETKLVLGGIDCCLVPLPTFFFFHGPRHSNRLFHERERMVDFRTMQGSLPNGF